MLIKLLISMLLLAESGLFATDIKIPVNALTQLETECANKTFESCYFLGLIKERAGATEIAKNLFQKACENGNDEGCVKLRNNSLTAIGKTNNPYTRIQFRTLSNGLRVGLLPSKLSEQVSYQLRLDAGMDDEKSNEMGVAHLTEHAIFQDPLMARESYMDELQRHQAQANAYTYPENTTFVATLPAVQLSWFVTQLKTMFAPRIFTDLMIEKSKKIIDIEGESRFVFLSLLIQEPVLGFNKTEFGISRKTPSMYNYFRYGATRTTKDVQTFFNSHYHPENMHLYLVGNFDSESLIQDLELNLKDLSSTGKQIKKEQEPQLRNLPYFMSQVSPTAPRITVGTKLWKVEAEEEMILRAYMTDLKKRLMAQLRSEEAHTYTVHNEVELDTRNFGSAWVSFETTPGSFETNLSFAKNLIQTDTQGNSLGEHDYARIKKDYLNQLASTGQDLETLMQVLRWTDFFQSTHKTEKSPYETLGNVSSDQMKNSLRKTFASERHLNNLLYAPLFFRFDTFVLFIVSMLVAAAFSRYLYRKNARPPSKRFRIGYSWAAHIGFYLGFLITLGQLSRMGQWLWIVERNFPSFIMNRLVYHYIHTGLFLSVIALALFYLSSFIVRSFWIEQDKIILRGLFGRRKEIKFSAISSIDATRPWLLFLTKPWKWRVFYFSLLCRRGLHIKLTNGTVYFLGAEDPEENSALLEKALLQQSEEGAIPEPMRIAV